MLTSLQGYKTYLCAAGVALATAAHYLGYVTDTTYQMLLAILGAGGVAAIHAAVSRAVKR